jgi:uncharacterized surface protein with fasciclin (FAS1) repeats
VSKTAELGIISTLARAGGFSTFLSLAEQAGLAKRLKRPGRFTLFAPTDEAFAKFPATTLERLRRPARADLLGAVVAAHLVAGQVLTPRLAGRRIRGASVQGTELVINGIGAIRVNGALIVRPDIMAANGVIHGIDKVLWANLAVEGEHPVSS